MMSDDDMDFTSANQSGRNLASLFQTGDSGATAPPAASTTYVAPKQPKKESPPRMMIASAVQAYSLGTDQKWATRGKLGVALLSTDNLVFQMILYASKTQTITSVRLTPSTVFTSQPNHYLAFQDDASLNWSMMFESKQAMIDFILQIFVAKAFLSGFKFDHFVQEIREGEGTVLTDHDGVEVTMNMYKVTENGTITAVPDTNDNKPIRVKIGKQQYGKAFDEVLKGMKKNGQRVAMISTNLYSVEVVRIKRDKGTRSSSIVLPAEEIPGPPPLAPASVERKLTANEDVESNERNRMLQRINRMGGISMMPHQNNPSAFTAPMPPNMSIMSDDDSIINEYALSHGQIRSTISTPAPPVQFVHPTYHHPHAHYPQATQPMIPQPSNMYPPSAMAPPTMPDFHTTRPGPSMTPTGYPSTLPPPWQQNPYQQQTPPDMFYPQTQQPFLNEFRQFLTRLTEKVDSLNEKFDEKTNKNHPNMETSILLANIQRIVKENETLKKDAFDRSAKVEELNLKISELLDRNQKLIEQSHQTAEQRNVVVNNVSEQTAQKILELEKQKVELTNNLSVSTSKIAELQLQVNQMNEESNDTQSRLTKLTNKCEQYREQCEKAENQRAEIQLKLDTISEQLKTEKLNKKQLQQNFNVLEEELNEVKETLSTYEKTANERKSKQENERRRWENELEEQKQSYEKDLEELRNKLRKQRTADSTINHQEIDRVEQEAKEKIDRLQTQHERILALKNKEIEQIRTSNNENETKLKETIEELNQSKEQIQLYEDRFEKDQERIRLMKKGISEMEDEQNELKNSEVKRTINMIYQKLKKRIRPEKELIGEEFLSRTLTIMKKVTLKVLSNDENDEESTDEEEISSQPTNGNSVDQKTLNDAVSTASNDNDDDEEEEEEKRSNSNENQTKTGWDTIDDLSDENLDQSQIVLVQEEKSSIDNNSTEEEEQITSPISTKDEIEQEISNEQQEESNASNETIEENLQLTKNDQEETDEDETPEKFESARASIQQEQTAAPPSLPPNVVIPQRLPLGEKIPLMSNDDDEDPFG